MNEAQIKTKSVSSGQTKIPLTCDIDEKHTEQVWGLKLLFIENIEPPSPMAPADILHYGVSF